MRGTYLVEFAGKAKTAMAFVAALAMSAQMFSFAAMAQKGVSAKKGEAVIARQDDQIKNDAPDQTRKNKIAPDLEENVDSLFRGEADSMQKVIIQLKPSTKINDFTGGEVSQSVKLDMIAKERAEARGKSELVRADLAGLGGKASKTFSNIGLMTAELPLSKIKALAESDTVAYISPDREVQSYGHVLQSTGMYNSGVYTKTCTANGDCWRDATGIGIAVVDSGIDANHKMFKMAGGAASRITASVNFVTNETRTDDPFGHGTHVAGLAAGDWAFGYSAYEGPAAEANIISLRALNGYGLGSTSNVVAAIDWAIANRTAKNIKVLNLSLGTIAKDSYVNDPLCQAARRAFNAGIVVVVSAGNMGKNHFTGQKVYGTINSPGIEPSAITVGALDSKGTDIRSDDTIATYSSKGPTRGFVTLSTGQKKYDNLIKPDLVAPGNKLLSARAANNLLASLNPSLKYGDEAAANTDKVMYMSGTSMSAPVVAGAVAVLLDTNPNLTPNLVKAILQYSAQPMIGVNTYEQGAGRLNLDGAVRVASLVKPTLPTVNGTAMLSAALPASQTSTIYGEMVYWGKGVTTNWVMLFGNDLMTKYQAMYAGGTLMTGATSITSGTMTRSTSLTSGTISMTSGAVVNNGVIIGDGIVVGDGVILGDGIVVGDGVILGDGIVVGDSILASTTACALEAPLGDPTEGMNDASTTSR